MKKITLMLAACVAIAGSAFAQSSPPFAPITTDIKGKTPHSAYVTDSRGVIVRNPFGLCWRTGYWTPADAVPGCDLPICVEPEKLENGKCVAPPPPALPPAQAKRVAHLTYGRLYTLFISCMANRTRRCTGLRPSRTSGKARPTITLIA